MQEKISFSFMPVEGIFSTQIKGQTNLVLEPMQEVREVAMRLALVLVSFSVIRQFQ